MVKVVSYSVGCCSARMMLSFAEQTLFSIIKFHLLIFGFSTSAVSVLFRKFYTVRINSSPFVFITSIRFRGSGLMLKSLIYLKFSFVHADKYVFICILLHANIRTICSRFCLSLY